MTEQQWLQWPNYGERCPLYVLNNEEKLKAIGES